MTSFKCKLTSYDTSRCIKVILAYELNDTDMVEPKIDILDKCSYNYVELPKFKANNTSTFVRELFLPMK